MASVKTSPHTQCVPGVSPDAFNTGRLRGSEGFHNPPFRKFGLRRVKRTMRIAREEAGKRLSIDASGMACRCPGQRRSTLRLFGDVFNWVGDTIRNGPREIKPTPGTVHSLPTFTFFLFPFLLFPLLASDTFRLGVIRRWRGPQILSVSRKLSINGARYCCQLHEHLGSCEQAHGWSQYCLF